MRPNMLDDLTYEENKHRLTPAVARAVSISFRDGGTTTMLEIRRRRQLCWEIAKQLRYDLGWGIARIADCLPHYLRLELDGVNWEPDKRQCWIPEDGG